jgi:hypothetical protein
MAAINNKREECPMTATKLEVSEVIAYKVFNEDWTCRGFQFEVGKSYHQKGEITPCENGFHACEKLGNCFGYYDFDTKNKVAKVRLFGIVCSEGDKVCASDIEIIEELTWERVLILANSGNCNSGNRNSGDRNSGNRNSGDWNSGYWNSGNWNSGNWNSGNWNSGNWNSGNWNSGNLNSGNWNSGYFNIDTPPTVRVFGKDIDRELWDNCIKPDFLYFDTNVWVGEYDMSTQEKIDNPKFFTTGGYLKSIPYKQAFIESFEKACKEDKKLVLQLPGFDKEMFYQISGIDIDKYDLS